VPLTGEPHYLQAGAFRDAPNASLFQDRLANLGFRPLTLKSEQHQSTWVYRVLIGPFANTAELEKTRVRMNARQLRTIPVIE
jgi:cell division protein FtsN